MTDELMKKIYLEIATYGFSYIDKDCCNVCSFILKYKKEGR